MYHERKIKIKIRTKHVRNPTLRDCETSACENRRQSTVVETRRRCTGMLWKRENSQLLPFGFSYVSPVSPWTFEPHGNPGFSYSYFEHNVVCVDLTLAQDPILFFMVVVLFSIISYIYGTENDFKRKGTDSLFVGMRKRMSITFWKSGRVRGTSLFFLTLNAWGTDSPLRGTLTALKYSL